MKFYQRQEHTWTFNNFFTKAIPVEQYTQSVTNVNLILCISSKDHVNLCDRTII